MNVYMEERLLWTTSVAESSFCTIVTDPSSLNGSLIKRTAVESASENFGLIQIMDTDRMQPRGTFLLLLLLVPLLFDVILLITEPYVGKVLTVT